MQSLILQKKYIPVTSIANFKSFKSNFVVESYQGHCFTLNIMYLLLASYHSAHQTVYKSYPSHALVSIWKVTPTFNSF
jgi:hypothetical protein